MAVQSPYILISREARRVFCQRKGAIIFGVGESGGEVVLSQGGSPCPVYVELYCLDRGL